MSDDAMSHDIPMAVDPLRIEKPVYGGDGLAHTAAGAVVFVPYVLPGELVQGREGAGAGLEVVEPSAERVAPACVHFGICGGCQYQMAGYGAQLAMKAAILRETLERAGVDGLARDLPKLQLWGSPEPYGYRNRIRLRVREVEGAVQMGYSIRGTREFLPVTMCPIAAPVLWAAVEGLLSLTATDRDAREWLTAATEVEFVCDDKLSKVQVHLLCAGTAPRSGGSFERFARGLERVGVPVSSMGASRFHAASGRATEPLAGWGTDGLSYEVGQDKFWLKRGSFFQVNRFLLPEMVNVVCGEHSGRLAWDLYAGAGLFARELARRYKKVTAVEASAVALDELRRGLRPGQDEVIGETTLAFLRKAVVQRERPELVVLDPPRAGAGEEAAGLLLRLGPRKIVYVSCDPTTLARDLKVLAAAYDVAELHMLDLFPQTYHLETVMVLRHKDVTG